MSNLIKLEGSLKVDCGKGLEFVLQLQNIHENAVENFLLRGAKACLQDCHANITLDSVNGDEKAQRDQSLAAIEKYVSALYAGTARIRGVSRGVASDSMSAFRIAALRDLFNAKHGKSAFAKLSKEDGASEKIKAMLEKFADKIEIRAKELKAEAEAKEIRAQELAKDFDLSDLGL